MTEQRKALSGLMKQWNEIKRQDLPAVNKALAALSWPELKLLAVAELGLSEANVASNDKSAICLEKPSATVLGCEEDMEASTFQQVLQFLGADDFEQRRAPLKVCQGSDSPKAARPFRASNL